MKKEGGGGMERKILIKSHVNEIDNETSFYGY